MGSCMLWKISRDNDGKGLVTGKVHTYLIEEFKCKSGMVRLRQLQGLAHEVVVVMKFW